MDSETAAPAPAPVSQQTYRQIAASHIEALSRLNSNLPDILALIAAALSQLTNHPIQSESREDSPRARDDDIRAFSTGIRTLMANFREALVEQINDLERYKVIPATMPRYTPLRSALQIQMQKKQQQTQEQQQQGQQGQGLDPAMDDPDAPIKRKVDPDAGVQNGGYGKFDVGVLNSQAANGLMSGEDALERVRLLLDDLLERNGRRSDGDEMVVDG
ncbi:hypothetical protein E8E13_007941 [Curvularia kusanoi]|uniref:Mediator of RNA polymerase II transcription subunit 11 n=1 Tax=Curvularia kusanoi TaxID=90978 RepID=A0A9P4W886_CURKU|nr:hypothetical protein E8E13_007941 [Curvularia kusanoi]